MSGPICYACLKPVEYLAQRCPHCTSPLSWGGNHPHAQSSPTATFIGLGFVLAVILAAHWGTWAFWVCMIVIIAMALAARSG